MIKHYEAGVIAIRAICGMQKPIDKAKEFHDAVQIALLNAGFRVTREAPILKRESGRGFGRIDLLAERNGAAVAIELDRRCPRAKSLDKLRAFDAFRIVVLRGAAPWSSERGIDAIISVPVYR
jgi:hypothetical protein